MKRRRMPLLVAAYILVVLFMATALPRPGGESFHAGDSSGLKQGKFTPAPGVLATARLPAGSTLPLRPRKLRGRRSRKKKRARKARPKMQRLLRKGFCRCTASTHCRLRQFIHTSR